MVSEAKCLASGLSITRLDDGLYEGSVESGWEFWFPNGGYVASIAFAAINEEVKHSHPKATSLHVQYLRAARVGQCEIRVEAQQVGKVLAILEAVLTQSGRTVLRLSCTMLAQDISGYDYACASMPDVPKFDQLRSYAECAEDFDDWFPMWRSVEGRPCDWPEIFESEPKWNAWLKVNDLGTCATSTSAVACLLMWADLSPFNALMTSQRYPAKWIAPNANLYLQIHTLPDPGDWMLAESKAPFASGGTVSTETRIWDQSGKQLATSLSLLICRSNPQFETSVS